MTLPASCFLTTHLFLHHSKSGFSPQGSTEHLLRMWSTVQIVEPMASLGPFNLSSGSHRNTHTAWTSLPSASTTLHFTHLFMWSMVLFLTLKFSDQLWLLPWVNYSLIVVWTTVPSWIYNSNLKPFPRLQIHSSNGLLNMFTLIFPKDCAFNILQTNSSISPLLEFCYGITIPRGDRGQQSQQLFPQHAHSTMNICLCWRAYHSGL